MKHTLEELYPNIFFIKEDRNYYIIINNERYKYDKKNIEEIKKKAHEVYKWKFYKMSMKEIERIIDTLNIEFFHYIIEEDNNSFNVYPYQAKKKISIYHIPYQHITNIKKAKPYLLIKKDTIYFLLEVTKEYALNHIDNYYYLSSELNEEERVMYNGYHKKIEYNNLYNIKRNSSTKRKTKTLKRKRYNEKM